MKFREHKHCSECGVVISDRDLLYGLQARGDVTRWEVLAAELRMKFVVDSHGLCERCLANRIVKAIDDETEKARRKAYISGYDHRPRLRHVWGGYRQDVCPLCNVVIKDDACPECKRTYKPITSEILKTEE